MAKTTAERMKKLRDRQRKAGLVLLQLWAHPDDHPQLKAFAARLLAKRRRP
jgi:hypothetical protein